MNTIWTDFARMIYNVEVEVEGDNGDGGAAAARPAAAAGASVARRTPAARREDQPSAYGDG